MATGVEELAVVDVDDTAVEVHGYAKQGARFGYNKVRGLNAHRHGEHRTRRAGRGGPAPPQRCRELRPRADSAFYGHAVVGTAVKVGAEVSVTVRLDKRVKAAIAAIPDGAWTTIAYTDAMIDERLSRR